MAHTIGTKKSVWSVKEKLLIKVEDEYGHAKEIPCPVCNKN
ncbi:hypothetical protein ODV97_18115 [Enterococcus gallinarum]|nr:hypothetical protein [Enterococcus gallinarum]